MMHLLVTDVDEWWKRIGVLKLDERYPVGAPAQPKLQPWGLAVAYVWYPSGVHWHIAQDREPMSAQGWHP